jgi:acyl-CoA synthetase (AMP-forming)/AMP-acid ligase II
VRAHVAGNFVGAAVDAAENDREDTLAGVLPIAAENHGEVAVVYAEIDGTSTFSVRELHLAARSVAASLANRGVRAGDTVAVQLPGGVEAAVVYQATFLLGAVLVPIVHIYGPTEVDFILRQSQARVLVIPEHWRSVSHLDRVAGYRDIETLSDIVVVGTAPEGCVAWSDLTAATPVLPAEPRVAPDDVCLLIYTSGTTSAPKGVLHSHRSLLAELDSAPAVMAAESDDVQLVSFPPGHIAGVVSFLRPMVAGSPSVFMDAWDPASAVRLIREHAVTSTSGTPFHLSGLLDLADNGLELPTLREFLVGAATVPVSLIRRADAFGIAAFRCYGCTEHPTVTAGNANDPLAVRISTDGAPLPGVSVRIVDADGVEAPTGVDGEILTMGPDRFIGYQDSALDCDTFDAAGWMRTGDLGHLDTDGRLTVTDRLKDVVIRGGETISSSQLEDVLLTHPSVAEGVIVAAPDSRYGEVVAAVVVPIPGARLELGDIAEHFSAAGLARQKTPERLVLVDSLPRTAVGKVRKADVRATNFGATKGPL